MRVGGNRNRVFVSWEPIIVGTQARPTHIPVIMRLADLWSLRNWKLSTIGVLLSARQQPLTVGDWVTLVRLNKFTPRFRSTWWIKLSAYQYRNLWHFWWSFTRPTTKLAVIFGINWADLRWSDAKFLLWRNWKKKAFPCWLKIEVEFSRATVMHEWMKYLCTYAWLGWRLKPLSDELMEWSSILGNLHRWNKLET